MSHQVAPPGPPAISRLSFSRNDSSTAFFSHWLTFQAAGPSTPSSFSATPRFAPVEQPKRRLHRLPHLARGGRVDRGPIVEGAFDQALQGGKGHGGLEWRFRGCFGGGGGKVKLAARGESARKAGGANYKALMRYDDHGVEPGEPAGKKLAHPSSGIRRQPSAYLEPGNCRPARHREERIDPRRDAPAHRKATEAHLSACNLSRSKTPRINQSLVALPVPQ